MVERTALTRGLLWVLGFGGGDGNHLDAAEGEGHCEQAGRDAAEAIRHEAVL